MKNFSSLLLLILLSGFLFSQVPFQGTFTVAFTNEQKETNRLEVKVRDTLVYLKSISEQPTKYDHYILNLASRDFYTVSGPDKKVTIKYNLDKLLALYEKEQLKEGFTVKSPIAFQPADKLRRDQEAVLAKYSGENEIYKAIFWLNTEPPFNFNQLIPLLRLLGYWNAAQVDEGMIASAEATNKVSKRQTSVLVTLHKEPVSKETFSLSKGYLEKDFAKLMEADKDQKDLKLLVKTFAEF
jgi:hypothetical protein